MRYQMNWYITLTPSYVSDKAAAWLGHPDVPYVAIFIREVAAADRLSRHSVAAALYRKVFHATREAMYSYAQDR